MLVYGEQASIYPADLDLATTDDDDLQTSASPLILHNVCNDVCHFFICLTSAFLGGVKSCSII